MQPLSSLTDLYDRSGTAHSNTKVIVFIVLAIELALVVVNKFMGLRDFGVGEVSILLSILFAAFGSRTLLAFWKIRANGNGEPREPHAPADSNADA